LIIKNPVIYQNEIIYVLITEVADFMDFIKEFITNVKTTNDNLTQKHEFFINKQNEVISHLKQINERPYEMPEYMRKQL
jgi:hypothetical protein